jgi:rhodanese-related sulfurtransferase
MNEIPKKELAVAREVCPTTSQRLLKEGALLIDVREPAEVAQVGFTGCEVMNIPLSQFEDRWQEIPRNRDAILACAVGERSLKATYFLMYQGYDRVMNMRPGIARWVDRGFPITGSPAEVTASIAASSCCGGKAEPTLSAASASCCGDTAVTPSEAGACCGATRSSSSCC